VDVSKLFDVCSSAVAKEHIRLRLSLAAKVNSLAIPGDKPLSFRRDSIWPRCDALMVTSGEIDITYLDV
jgi:hypothetical protein